MTPSLIAGAFTGQQNRPVCNPLSNTGFTYIDCKSKKVAPCRPPGTAFDYTTRKCLPMAAASQCPTFMCPVTGGAALSCLYGTCGKPGNVTIPLPVSDSFRIICPVYQGGKTFQFNVACPAPPERFPYVWFVDWDEVRSLQSRSISFSHPQSLRPLPTTARTPSAMQTSSLLRRRHMHLSLLG